MAVSRKRVRKKQKSRSAAGESLYDIAKKRFTAEEMERFGTTLDRYVKEEREFTAHMCWVVVFSALRDKFGFGHIRLSRAWNNVHKLLVEIGEHRIKLADLEKALKEEAGITFETSEK